MFPGWFQRIAVLALMLLVLSGCTTFSTLSTPALNWDDRRKALATIKDWHASGRVAMQTDDDAWSASLDWNQTEKASYVIRLSGPLGGNVMIINGGPGYAVMETAEGEKVIESSAGRLIENYTGWQIPVEGLQYWALALVEPGPPAESTYDDKGRLSRIRQSGWVIDYLTYQLKGNIEMPRKIHLVNDHFKVKLIIKDWQLGPEKS